MNFCAPKMLHSSAMPPTQRMLRRFVHYPLHGPHFSSRARTTSTMARQGHRLASSSPSGQWHFRNIVFASSSSKNADQKTHNGKQYHHLLDIANKPDPPGLVRRPDPPGLKMGCRALADVDNNDKRKPSTMTKAMDSSPTLQKYSPVSESNTRRCLMSLPKNISDSIITTKTMSCRSKVSLSSKIPKTKPGPHNRSSSSSISSSTKEESSSSSNDETLDDSTADAFTMDLDAVKVEEDETVMASNRSSSANHLKRKEGDSKKETTASSSGTNKIKMDQKDAIRAAGEGKMNNKKMNIPRNVQKASTKNVFPMQFKNSKDKEHSSRSQVTKNAAILSAKECHTNGPSAPATTNLAEGEAWEQQPNIFSHLDHETIRKVLLWQKAKQNVFKLEKEAHGRVVV